MKLLREARAQGLSQVEYDYLIAIAKQKEQQIKEEEMKSNEKAMKVQLERKELIIKHF